MKNIELIEIEQNPSSPLEDKYKVEEENSIHFELDSFSGPLDLLLFLVREQKIDIYDIPIAEITDQYLKYLQEMLTYDLDTLTDFYRTATWLLQIKSRSLLPIPTNMDEDEINTTHNELINTLIEYQKYKKLSTMLSERYEEFNWVSIRKETITLPLEFPQESIWKEVQSTELFSMFIKLINRQSDTCRVIELNESVTINEKITLLYELLDKNTQCSFEEVVAEGGVLSIVCSLLALLELMKQQKIKTLQHSLNGNIIILRGESL